VPSGLTSNSALLIASTPLTADPEPWFAEALEETRVESQLQPIVASRLPSDRKLALRQIKTIHHKPRQRCVIAYDFRVIDESGIQTNCRVLGKARRKPMKLSAYDIQLRISALTANHSKTPLRVAQPLGIVSSWNLWLQEYLEGQRADELIAPGEYLIVSARIGEALGHLHSLALTTDSVHSFDDELAILRHSLQAVQILDIERIENLIGDCQRLLKSIPVTCLTGIHRDFYPAQVIYKDNEPVGIVDFDLFSWGAAAIDVGNFVAHLKETALRSFGSHSALEDHETEFVNAYLRVNPDVSRESIDVLTVVSLARHVAISQRIPQREVWTQPILSLCEQLMEQVAVRWQTGSEGVRLDPPRAALSGVSSISRFEPNN
jgi:Ser/Thr protein kinase RdoA (MazF antagonist)